MKYILVLTFCMLSYISTAQPFIPQWTRSYGADSTIEGFIPTAIISDSANSIYVGGIKDTTHQNNRFFIEKYDSSGNKLWISYYDNNSNQVYLSSLVLDNQGNIIVGGNDYYNFIILKYDMYGNLIWKYKDSTTVHHELHSVQVDSSGNVYGVGSFNNTFDQSQIIKLTPGGSLIWQINSIWGKVIYSGLYLNQLQFAVDEGGLIRLDTAGLVQKSWTTTSTNLSVVKTDSVSNFFIVAGYKLYRVDSSFHTVWNISYPPPYQNYYFGDIALSGNFVYTTGPVSNNSIIFGKFSYSGINYFHVVDTTIFSGLRSQGIIEADNNHNLYVVGSKGQFAKILLKFDSTGVMVDSVSIDSIQPYQWVYSHFFFNKRFSLGCAVGGLYDRLLIFQSDDQFNDIRRYYDTNYQEAVESGNELKVLANGNIVGGGLYKDSMGYNNIILNCFDPAGSSIWAVHFTANPTLSFDVIQSDPTNNLFIAGRTNDSTYICKFSAGGILQWMFKYSMVTSQLISDQSGNIYVLGADTVSTLLKLDPTGTLVWVKHYGYHSSGYAITLSNGNIDLGIIEYNGPDTLFNYKVDNQGNVIWKRQWNIVTNSAIYFKLLTDYNGDIASLAINDSGIYFMKCNQAGNILWENNQLDYNSQNGASYDFDIGSDNSIYFVALYQNVNRGYIRKLDSSGTLVWEDSVIYPGLITSKLLEVKCVNDFILIGGWYSDSLTGKKGLFMIYDTTGNKLFTDSFPIVENTNFNTIKLDYDNSGNYYVLVNDTMQNNNLHLRKYANNLVRIGNQVSYSTDRIYPNPVTDIINMRLESKASRKCMFIIYDMNSKILESGEVVLEKGINVMELSIKNIPAGFYRLTILSNNKAVTEFSFCKM
jgi:hypothetical protein